MSEQTFLLIVAVIMVVVFVGLLSFLSAVLWQLVKILREVRGIMANIRLGSDTLAEDIANVRSHIKTFILGRMAGRFGASRKKKRASNSSESNTTEE
jgi:hypothetical protein